MCTSTEEVCRGEGKLHNVSHYTAATEKSSGGITSPSGPFKNYYQLLYSMAVARPASTNYAP